MESTPQVFDVLLVGQWGVIIIEGAVGREEFAIYVQERPHEIMEISQVERTPAGHEGCTMPLTYKRTAYPPFLLCFRRQLTALA